MALKSQEYDWSAPKAQPKEKRTQKLRILKVKDGTTRRVLIVGDQPIFMGYTHNMFSYMKHYRMQSQGQEVILCPVKNDTEYKGQKCPLCESMYFDKKAGKNQNLSFATKKMFMVGMDLGQVQVGSDDLTYDASLKVVPDEYQGKFYQFQPVLIPVSIGSEKKPGLEAVFRKMRKENGGNLNGLLCSATRSGELDHGVGGLWESIGLNEEAGKRGGPGISRLQLPFDEAGLLATVKNYIRSNPQVFGTIPDDDNRMKWLSVTMPTIEDLSLYSPSELTVRYGANTGSGTADTGSTSNQTDHDDQDIPF